MTAWLRRTAIFVVVFVASSAILYGIVIDARLYADFPAHLRFATELAEGKSAPGHFLFHLATIGISTLGGGSIEQSATILIAASVGACALIIHELYLVQPAATPDKDAWARTALTVAALIVTAIYVPPFNRLYHGQSSPTVWHNPTSMLLKPFALVAAICLERVVFHGARGGAYAIACVAVILGMLAKPAFALVLIPTAGALAAYMSLPLRWRFLRPDVLPVSSRTRNLLLALVGVTAGLLLVQGSYIYATERGIVVAPLAVWGRQTPSIPLSIFLAIAFPLAVTELDVRRGTALRGVALGWGFVISGAVVFALFAEPGTAFKDGNFVWGYQIALATLFAFAMRSYLHQWREGRRDRMFFAASALLAAHALSGVFYLYQILGRHTFY